MLLKSNLGELLGRVASEGKLSVKPWKTGVQHDLNVGNISGVYRIKNYLSPWTRTKNTRSVISRK